MASREVVVSVCDRCTTEVTTPLKRKNKKNLELVLPPGWLHIAANTATALVFEMDLCAECKQIVLEVAGKSRQVHSTSSRTKGKPEAAAKKADAERDSAVTNADVQQEDNALVGVG